MFQLIGSLLALFAIVSALSGAPVAGTLFALSTFVWVLVAKPHRSANLASYKEPWGAIYEMPYSTR
jgi:hypothetical protein